MPQLEPLMGVLQGALPRDTARARGSPQGHVGEPYRCRQGRNLGALLPQVFEQSGQKQAGSAPGIPQGSSGNSHAHLPSAQPGPGGDSLMLQGGLW